MRGGYARTDGQPTPLSMSCEITVGGRRWGEAALHSRKVDSWSQFSPEKLTVGAGQHLAQYFDTPGAEFPVHLVQSVKFLL
jgi:hypothetical protein